LFHSSIERYNKNSKGKEIKKNKKEFANKNIEGSLGKLRESDAILLKNTGQKTKDKRHNTSQTKRQF
jgi:hypothetical protein